MHNKKRKYRPMVNILHRGIAIAMGTVLLAGQLEMPVYAEEIPVYSAPVEPSDQETDVNESEEEKSEIEKAPEEETDNKPEAEQPSENGNEGQSCVCENVCSEGSVNPDCNVCAADYEKCSKKLAADGESVPEEEDGPNENTDGENIGEENNDEGTGVLQDVITVESNIEGVQKESAALEEHAGEPLLAGALFDVLMTAEPNIRLVCQVIDDENQRVAVRHVVYDGAASDEVEIPPTVSYYGCDYMVTEIGIEGGNSVFSNDAVVTRVKVPEGVTVIRDRAFAYCNSLITLELPDSLTEIGHGAFWSCSGLCEVRVPDGVTVIGAGAFGYCSGLTNINLPPQLREVRANMFLNCSNLTAITLPDTLTAIGERAFENTALQEIWIPDSVIEIGSHAFNTCNDLKKVRMPSGLSCISGYMFGHCTSLTEIEIPSKVTKIEDQAFWDCPLLQGITLPSAVAYLGYGAFAGCTGVTELRIAIAFREENGGRNIVPVALNERMPGSVFANVEPAVWKNRAITFLNEDATALLEGDDLDMARQAYMSVNDGNMEDNRWYGWKIFEETDSTTPGEVNPPEDGSEPDGTDQPGIGDNHPDDKKPGGEGEVGGADSTGGENSDENADRRENPDNEITPAEAVAVAAVEEAAQTENTQPAAVEAGGIEMPAVQNGQNQAATDKPAAPEDTQGEEPKTGDAAHVEVYATIAMIAGLAYLLLYFMEEGRGMTEREKEVFVAAFIRWAKKGGTFRRYCALAAIFCILVYYHAVGKYAGTGNEDRTPALNGR